MKRITLKKTQNSRRELYLKRGAMTTPASYDIYLDGKKVGTLTGYCETRLRDSGACYRAEAFGQKLRGPVGARGVWRKTMETEILAINDRKETA